MTARELITEFFDCLRNLDTSIDRCTELFAEDGVFEFPYLPSIGMGGSYAGKIGVKHVLEIINSNFSLFTLSNIEISELKEEIGLFVEHHSDSFLRGTERVYSQDYVTRLMVENGKIKLLREYMNTVLSARILFPNGVQDVPETMQ